MRFHAEHRFGAPPDAVARGMLDARFYRTLQLPDLGLPEVVAEEHEDGDAILRLRYEFSGSLDATARRLLGGRRLVWLQEVRLDRSRASGTLSFRAEADPRRLFGSARFVLDVAPGGTIRRLDGELSVAVPGIGRFAEARIVPGVCNRLDLEAVALEQALSAAS